MKDDKEKPNLSLIPPEVLPYIAKVFMFGAAKYGENNWRKDINNTSYGRTYSSIQRHLNSFWTGEDIDPESGMEHIDHAITQLMILKMQTLETTNKEMDNRYKKDVKLKVKGL